MSARCHYPDWTLPRTASLSSAFMRKTMQGEATEEKQWRLSLTWRSNRLHHLFMDCISPGASAFLAWKERFSSVCGCLSLLMEKNSTQWAFSLVSLHGSFLGDPPVATLQHLCARAGLLHWPVPAWHGSDSLWRWAKGLAAGGQLRWWILSTQDLGQKERRDSGADLGQENGKTAAGCEWRQHSNLVTWPWLGFKFLLSSVLRAYSLNYQLHTREVTSPLRALAGVRISQANNTVVDCREGKKCSLLAFPFLL